MDSQNYSNAFRTLLDSLMVAEKVSNQDATEIILRFAVFFASVENLLRVEEAAQRFVDRAQAIQKGETVSDYGESYQSLIRALGWRDYILRGMESGKQ